MRKRHVEPPPDAPLAPTEQLDTILTVAEVAARWRCNRHTVTAAIRAGRLQAFKPDRRVWRVSMVEVLRFEQQQSLAVAS